MQTFGESCRVYDGEVPCPLLSKLTAAGLWKLPLAEVEACMHKCTFNVIRNALYLHSASRT